MKLEISLPITQVIVYMQQNLPENQLQSVAEGVAKLAPVIWRNYPKLNIDLIHSIEIDESLLNTNCSLPINIDLIMLVDSFG